MKKEKVVLGMSGGVDSSVSAYLLKKAGYDVIGLFMRNWDSMANNDILGNKKLLGSICPEEQDWIDAQSVARKLKIPIFREDLITEYWDEVFENMIDEYKKGRTPNPDLLCNKYIKFGHFQELATKKYNAKYIATGHYADLSKDHLLIRAKDESKDQSYFLAQVPLKNLENVIFPLGKILKKDVRILAKKLKLVVATKKDSTGICFIGERDFSKFLQNYIPAKPGDILDIETNKKIGTHIGIMYYTIGQRKGLNLGGMTEPYYVAGHNIKKRIIYAAKQSSPKWLISTMCSLENVNIIDNSQKFPAKLSAKFRYRQKDVPVTIEIVNNVYYVKYPEGVEAVTPGQQCVIYNQKVCVGGGVINKVYQDNKLLKYL